MMYAQQKIYIGAQNSPIQRSLLRSGSFRLNYAGVGSQNNLDYSYTAQQLKAYIEQYISPVDVEDALDGYVVTFQLHQSVELLETYMVNLYVQANTIQITTLQTGQEDVNTEVSVQKIRDQVEPIEGVNERGYFSLTGDDTVVFTINNGTVEVTLFFAGETHSFVNLTEALQELFGANVTAQGNGIFVFDSSLGDVSITINKISGTQDATYTEEIKGVAPVTGVYEQQKVTFTNIPTAGSWLLEAVETNWDATAQQIEGRFNNVLVTGNTTIGFTFTFTSYGSHDLLSVSRDDLRIVGRPHRFKIEFTDNPTTGYAYPLSTTTDGQSTPISGLYEAVHAAMDEIVDGWHITCVENGPWTFESVSNTQIDSVSLSEYWQSPLQRLVSTMEVIVLQQGSEEQSGDTFSSHIGIGLCT